LSFSPSHLVPPVPSSHFIRHYAYLFVHSSETSHTPKKKPAKTARRWVDSALSPEDMAALDYSSAPGVDSDIDPPSRPLDLTQLIDESSRGAVRADGLYEVKDLDLYGATGAKDDDTEDIIARALSKTENPKDEPAAAGWSAFSAVGGLFSRFTGGKVLTAEDLAPVLNGMREHLMKKNVAKEIADKICESVGESLVGTRVSGFASACI
jgi:signal recognition particle receptor subunit alpha